MKVRDRQAFGYLAHRKFPTQIWRIEEAISRAAARQPQRLPVLDLGCGPGPTTGILLRAGFSVLAVDFSMESLKLNLIACRGLGRVLFTHADLTKVRFATGHAGGLMMADFLQHLEPAAVRRAFLAGTFEALAPGGWFFLSFFNVNVWHRLRGDIDGSWIDGGIRYHRFAVEEAMALLPTGIAVERILPMNIFHRARPDRLAARSPFARLFARMILMVGTKA